jgi:hypothetical protein
MRAHSVPAVEGAAGPDAPPFDPATVDPAKTKNEVRKT